MNNPRGEPSDWLLIVEDVFPRWRDCLGSSVDATYTLEALLSDPETRSARHKVDASGEIPGTSEYLDGGFWQDSASLLLVPDADGGADHIAVHDREYVHPAFGESTKEFFVRRIDVERWERLYPELAAPPPRAAKGPVRGEIDRFGDADRALFPEIKRLMESQRLTSTEAVRQIPEDKLAGRGTLDSRIRRVSDRFRREKP